MPCAAAWSWQQRLLPVDLNRIRRGTERLASLFYAEADWTDRSASGSVAPVSPNLAPLVLAADLMRTDVTPLRPDDRLDRALELFVESDLLALPVVEGVEVARVIGIVKRVDVSSTYLKYVQGDGSNMVGSGI